jgi:hypothetical protein
MSTGRRARDRDSCLGDLDARIAIQVLQQRNVPSATACFNAR